MAEQKSRGRDESLLRQTPSKLLTYVKSLQDLDIRRNENYMTYRRELNTFDFGLRTNPYVGMEKTCSLTNKMIDDQITYTMTQDIISVKTDAKFQSMINYISTLTEIALDLEGHDRKTFLGQTALIQIGTPQFIFLVEPFDLILNINTKLKRVLESDKILKILHGGRNDMLWLQRDFGIFIYNIMDTQLLYNYFPKPPEDRNDEISLKDLALKILGHVMDKTFQSESIWLKRECVRIPGGGKEYQLPKTLQQYAADDVRLLLKIWEIMKEKTPWEKIVEAAEVCQGRTIDLLYDGHRKNPIPTKENTIPKYDSQMTLIHEQRFGQLLHYRFLWSQQDDKRLDRYLTNAILFKISKEDNLTDQQYYNTFINSDYTTFKNQDRKKLIMDIFSLKDPLPNPVKPIPIQIILPLVPPKSQPSTSSSAIPSLMDVQVVKPEQKQCFNCGELGHLMADCWGDRNPARVKEVRKQDAILRKIYRKSSNGSSHRARARKRREKSTNLAQ